MDKIAIHLYKRQFDPRRFADPKAMTDELHALGYKVMMWVVPFVSMDSPGYREMAHGMLDAGVKCEKGGLVLQSKQLNFDQYLDARPFAWWNGKSAYVDYTHPRGCAWFARELKRLCDDYGVDGFKFDSGDYGSGMAYLGRALDGGRALDRRPQAACRLGTDG